ncbi:unnamed protein product [Dibothriocephalus latus]|uniref:Aminopeptidase N-like N-terminal domain-containing protein n=1 Tax=Dibothriocephalus latus TaxID=60516 RepID=A0A3P7M962_DIBLA|nr:unnamed protein product [Dibothriocephalus latus]
MLHNHGVAQTTNDVVLNAKNIEILSAFCKLGAPASIKYDETLELVTLHFESPIKEGRFVLNLEFKGKLNDNMEGFYRSTAKTEAGKEQIILSTDFEVRLHFLLLIRARGIVDGGD